MLLLVALNDLAVGWLKNILVKSYATHAVKLYATGAWILDVGHASSYLSIYLAVFKHAITARVEGAVFKHQVLIIAQWLLTANVAAH